MGLLLLFFSFLFESSRDFSTFYECVYVAYVIMCLLNLSTHINTSNKMRNQLEMLFIYMDFETRRKCNNHFI